MDFDPLYLHFVENGYDELKWVMQRLIDVTDLYLKTCFPIEGIQFYEEEIYE